MNPWTCEKCGQKFPAKYRERHLKAHEAIESALREYDAPKVKYKRKENREEETKA